MKIVKERRKSSRVEVDVSVVYEIIKGPKTTIGVQSKNLSLGGIKICAYERLPKGALLNLGFNLPESKRPIFTKAEVVWSKKSAYSAKLPGQTMYDCGIKFTRINQSGLEKLRRFIRQRKKLR